MPNQTMKSGKSAILGIGNSAETTGESPARITENNAMASPTATPMAVPSVQPTISRNRLASR